MHSGRYLRISQNNHSLSFVVTRYLRFHSLYHSLYHSLLLVIPLVVTRCHSLYQSLSLVVTRCITRLSFYKRSYKKHHLKTRKMKCLLNKVLTISLYYKDMVELYYVKGVQKQPFADVLQNRCSWKFCWTHGKTPTLELLFNNVARLKRLHHKCFPMIFVKFSRTTIF